MNDEKLLKIFQDLVKVQGDYRNVKAAIENAGMPKEYSDAYFAQIIKIDLLENVILMVQKELLT